MNGLQLSSLLQGTSVSISKILAEAEKSFSEKPDEFITTEFGMLGAAISCYCSLFKRTDCQSRNELETSWSKHFSESSIRDAVEELLTIEEEWDKFLLKVDEFMDKKSSGSKGMAWNFNTKSGSSSVIELTNINENTVSTIGQIINNQPSLFILLRHFA